uniref:Uncharacterized protein n=1 Tax=Salix viminalis TaxID=40686 RepID=A0A6N2KHT4_SALVM
MAALLGCRYLTLISVLTSQKVYWKDDGFEEVLYTLPGKEKDSGVAKGGIGLVINDASEGGSKGSLISSSEWTVKDVDSDSIDAVQSPSYPLSMASAVIVKNNGRKDVTLTSAILSHLKFKKRAKAGIQGLRKCWYCTEPPLSSPFEVLSPSEALKPESPGLLDFDFEPEEKRGSWKVQEEPYIILKDRLSRVYAAPPQERLKAFYNTSPTKYETLDQGKELFFRVIRIGFEDIYVGSPGSSAEKYGNDYFICTGPAAMLVPVVVKPGEEWKGAQMIEHDNFQPYIDKWAKPFFSPLCAVEDQLFSPLLRITSMALSSLFSLSFNSIPFTNPTNRHLCNYHHHLHSGCIQYSSKKREFPPPSVASIPYQPINVDYLEEEFSGHGVTFEGLGDSCVAKMTVENGSSVTLMLPSGLITSYKARMWHGGTVELLQTSVSEGEGGGGAAIRGGVSPVIKFDSDGEISWSPSTWALQDIRGDSLRYILSLREETLSSELTVSNLKSSSIQMRGGIISHLTVSTPEATFAYGLEGSDFCNRPVFLSNFGIVPPGLSQNRGFGSGQMWENLGLKGFFTGWDARNQKNGDEGEDSLTESEEMEGREGFEELYIFSPGSRHESYGMYSFICVGQSAMLKPVTLNPGDAWTGTQHLHNPNI